MMIRAIVAGLLCGLLVSYSFGCGGGGSAVEAISPAPMAAAVVAQAPPVAATGPNGRLAFQELWEPRTADTGVFGVVHDVLLVATPDGSDPQVPWKSAITARWGGLAWPDVSGLGPNRFWRVDGGRLHFHAGGADNFALISGLTFSRSTPIVLEADFVITAGGESAFAGLALIAGEGDYREIAIRRNNGVDLVKRNTPLRETVLAPALAGTNRLRIEYDPRAGFRYIVNGALVGTEALDHEGASFSADPSVGLYFAASADHPGAIVEGSVGPVRVWTSPPKEAGNA